MTDTNKPKMGELFGGESSGGFLGMATAPPGEVGESRVVLMGAPCATPYVSVGPYCASAPKAVRNAFGWPGVLEHHDFDLGGTVLADAGHALDWGDLPWSASDFESNRRVIREHVEQVLAAGAKPIVIGGDDSIPVPVLEAYEDSGPVSILQLDAHIDWRDEVGGERYGLSSNMRRASEMTWVENITQIGARGLGSARPNDVQDALDWGVHLLPMEAVVNDGMAAVLDNIPRGARLFINLDIDVMDPAVVPAVIGPAPGGFQYWQMIRLLKAVAERADIVGFCLTELMPANDVGGRGALVAARLVTLVLSLLRQSR